MKSEWTRWIGAALVVAASSLACGSGGRGGASPSGGAGGITVEAQCAPSECPPCDETKQKCMGPSVCGGHPEKAVRKCTRDDDGKCTSKLVCETFSP
jgi:hypothetical protein